MVVFDATVLIDLFDPRTQTDRKVKLDHLIAELQRKKTKIVIPTPALAELLARAGKARDDYHQRLATSAAFKIGTFDNRAAMECALMLDGALTRGDKRANTETWAKAKFDWQIAAIAKVANANTIYSDDPHLARIGARHGLTVIKTDDLPLPDSARQHKLDFPE
jgi:predicted nucleic acid-binding protein